MLNIGYYGARPLGHMVRQIAEHDPRTRLVELDFEHAGWWGWVGADDAPRITHEKRRHPELRPDLIISVLTGHIFTAAQINATPLGIINLHPAPLPELRGCNSYAHAIIDQRKQYGVTLHYVDETIDTGPIIAKWTMPIHKNDTGRSLHDRAQGLALSMFATEWEAIVTTALRGERQQATPQTAMRNTVAEYHRRNSLDPYRVLADHPPEAHDRIKRALTFHPFPPPR